MGIRQNNTLSNSISCATGAFRAVTDDGQNAAFTGGILGAVQFVPIADVGVDTIVAGGIATNALYGCVSGMVG